jgi:hypothetical protein
MALSDCAKCWETPCICGHDYKTRPTQWILDLIKILQAEIDRRGGDAA